MDSNTANHIGQGLGWLGFWLFLGMVFFNPRHSTLTLILPVADEKESVNISEVIKYVDEKTDWIDLNPTVNEMQYNSAKFDTPCYVEK